MTISAKQTQQKSEDPDAHGVAAVSAKRRRNDLATWTIAIIALLANAPLLFVDFVFDDHPIVEHSQRVTEMQLGKIWATSYCGSS